MAYRSGNALRSAVYAGGSRITNALQRVFAQRLMNRMEEHLGDDVVFKGGQALSARYPQEARATYDLDIALRADSREEALEKLLEAVAKDARDTDHLRFEPVRTRHSNTPGLATTQFQVHLGAHRHNQVKVDLAAERSLDGIAERIPVVPLVQLPQQGWSQTWPVVVTHEHAAEKISRLYTQFHSGGSSAPRDVVDLALLAKHGNVDPDALVRSLRRVQQRPLAGGSHLALPQRFEPPERLRPALEAAGYDWEDCMRSVSSLVDPALRRVHHPGVHRPEQDPITAPTSAADQDDAPAGSIWVSPHVRNGVHIAGHWRRPRS